MSEYINIICPTTELLTQVITRLRSTEYTNPHTPTIHGVAIFVNRDEGTWDTYDFDELSTAIREIRDASPEEPRYTAAYFLEHWDRLLQY